VERVVNRPCSTAAAWSRVLLCSILVSLPFTLRAGPRVQVQRQTRIDLAFKPLTASVAPGTDPAALALAINPHGGGETEFRLLWPGDDSTTLLKLNATRSESAGSTKHLVALEALLTLPDGSKVRSSTRFDFDERTTALFEVYRIEGNALTLIVEAEASEETIISRGGAIGPPVRFFLEIQRVQDGKTISLETNLLQTFVGEAVSYGFRLGDTPASDAARLSLRPVRMSGELLEIEVEIDGTLPMDEELVVLGRRESWIASRGVVSTFSFESGEPPEGYRFLVTADF
jgi:hypothetical protein